MKTDVCPERDTLGSHLLGKLRGEQADFIDQHLETCDDCLKTARELDAADEFTDGIRAGKPELEGSESGIEEVIERGKQLQFLNETMETDETFAGNHVPQAGSEPNASTNNPDTILDADIDFLAPAEQPDEIGRLGGYRVLSVLGVGGMGVVFRAEDPDLKRQIALKAMKPAVAASKSYKDRFLREAQATASIEHDNIVAIHQVGEDRGIPFIAMPYLRGKSLQTYVKREMKIDQREVLRIGREVAAGLAAAHDRGLIHRDIKPDNIWLEEKSDRAKVLDFGLVRAVSDGDTALTMSGMVLGTPKYMAPEQALGETIDHRCDLFSLGSVLYHLATGKAPFPGGNITATLMAVAQSDPTPIESRRDDLHPDLVRLIMRLLSKDREQRPQTATEVVGIIADIEQQLVAAEAEKVRQKQLADTIELDESPVPVTQPKSHKPRFIAGVVVALVLLGFVGMWYSGILLKVDTPAGTIVVEIDQPESAGAVVLVDGKRKITIKTGAGQEPIEIVADEKMHTLRVTKGGFETFTKQFTVKAGGKQTIKVRLVPTKKTAPVNTPMTDREVAEWVLGIGGKLSAANEIVTSISQLPKQASRITNVYLNGNRQVTDDDLKHFKGLPNLHHLNLPDTQVGDAGLKHLEDLTNLATLHLSETQVSDVGLEHLKGLTKRRILDLQNTQVTGTGLVHLKGLTNLKSLSFGNTQVGDKGLVHLKGLTNLEHINLNGTQVGDKGLGHLKGLTKLEILEIRNTQVGDTGLNHIKGLTKLRGLLLGATHVSDNGLADVGKLTNLTHLYLNNNTQIGATGLQHLNGLTKLTALALNLTKVGDKGLEHLKRMAKLTFLNLAGTKTSDAGLQHLKGLTKLERLILTQTKVTAQGVADIQKALPKCDIKWDGGTIKVLQ